MVARLEGGDFHPQPGMEGRAIEAAHRARVISRVISALPDSAGNVLEDAFSGDAGERIDILAVMLNSQEVREAHASSRSKRPVDEWLSRLCTSNEHQRLRLFVLLKGSAERKVEIALQLFVEATEAYAALGRGRLHTR